MAHIKKLVMKGFKSFARQTEVPFDRNLSVIIGPNGSGKSNITDALCFVLGRLSVKSMRAERAANLIYNGGKEERPFNEAAVEIVFDNSENEFAIASNEVRVERIVRRNGISVYKINGETKTRQEIIELLAQGGIDPNGFNIIMQAEISNFVEMHPEERREIIEEVAGIRIYEMRKEKSLHELEKTEERIKEVGTVLNERTAYLKNLEKDRGQALRYEGLKNGIIVDKACLVHRKIKEKEEEKEKINKEKEGKEKELAKLKEGAEQKNNLVKGTGAEVENIDKSIQNSGGIEQESLSKEITEIKARTVTLTVRMENNKNQIDNLEIRNNELKKNILTNKENIKNLLKDKPNQAKKFKLLEEKEDSLSKLEGKQEQINGLKARFSSMEFKLKHNKEQITGVKKEIDVLSKQISELSKETSEIKVTGSLDTLGNHQISGAPKTCKFLSEIKKELMEIEEKIADSEKKFMASSEKASNAEAEISRLEKLKQDAIKLDICPLCKRAFTAEHKKKIIDKTEKEINAQAAMLGEEKENRSQFESILNSLKKDIHLKREHQSNLRILEIKLDSLVEKQKSNENLMQKLVSLEKEIQKDESEREKLELQLNESKETEARYLEIREQLEALRKGEDKNIDAEIETNRNDISKMEVIIKQNLKQIDEFNNSIAEFNRELKEKEKLLEEKEEADKKMHEEFKSLFDKKSVLQEKKNNLEKEVLELSHSMRMIEDSINASKIMLAEVDAKLSVSLQEFEEYKSVQLPERIPNAAELAQRIETKQQHINEMGSVNMKALEVYDSVKADYDEIAAKADKLKEEKLEIMNIITEIDSKKRKAFTKVLTSVNEGFHQNYLKLGRKEAFLDVENKEDPFAGGLNIMVRLAKGKYLDANSLSGGEKTLVALSLIFAIQDYKPYSFYLFDEIDAALDKRNSERLAALVKENLRKGQYIVVTHNDAFINEATSLFGVSMQDGVSKLISLRV